MKYVAIKLSGQDFWMYFKREDIELGTTVIKASGGWGKGGALIEKLEINANEVTGSFQTDTLQYGH